MSSFFRKETKNRIMAGFTAGAVLTSSLVGMAPKAFAEETTPATTVTTPVTPEAPAPAEASQPAPAEPETPAAPAATTEETTPAAAPTTEENSTVTAGTPAAAEPPAGAITPGETPATPAPTPATPSVTSTTFTFTQDNIPGARENVPSDKFATQFVSDVSLNGTKFVGDSGSQVTAPSGLTDPDGHTVVKWVTADGSDEMAPGETRPIDGLNGLTFHAVWQPKDGDDDVQYRLVINANGGHFEGGLDTMVERHDFLPADMPNVKAATKMTRDGFTLAGFSYDKNGTATSARSLTEALGIRDAEHIPGHTTDGALPTKTDEIYTLYAIWKDNSQTRTDEYRYVFMGNGGHVADDANVIHSTVVRGNDSDVAAISAPAMVRDGYTFVGWGASNASTEAESLGVNSANFSGITADESVDGTTDIHTRRVYAIWKQNTPATQHKNTYVFDANGGTIAGSTDTTSTTANANPAEAANVAAPKAEKAGYTFVGWAKDPGASTTFVLGNDHVDFSSVGFTVENDTDGSVIHVYKVYAVYKLATTPTPTPDPGTNPVTPGTGEHVPTDGVPPTLEPVAGKNTIMFYSGKLNKGETSVTNTGEHADVVAPNREYSLADGTMVKRWISTDGTVILLPGGHYDADSIKDKVFVADYVTATPPDYDPTQNYPQNVSHIQLHFHANGGKGEHGETVYAISGDTSATDLPVRPTFTREGYTFKGWSRNGLDTETNVIVNNNMVNLKSIGKRSEMTDPKDPSKVIVVYDVYAVWQKDEVTPDNPVTPPTPDTPGGHNGEITPGEPGGGTGTVTPDNPVTPDAPIAPDTPSVTPSTNETPSQPTKTEKTTVTRKKTDIPDTGDAPSMTGVIAGLASLFGSFAFFRKRKNQ
jgi:skin secretory protein xP2